MNRIIIGLINPLKKLSYRPEVSRMVWRFGLAGALRKIYYVLNRPSGGIVKRNINGEESSFYVRTPWELRALDPAGQMGREQHVLDMVSELVRPGDTVFDIGSNFGVYTIPLSKRVGSNGLIVAFEPEPQAFDHLLNNILLNQLGNVKSYNIALSDNTHKTELFLQYTGASRLERPNVSNADSLLVDVYEGDRFILAENIPVPTMVKIDVEGHEWKVMKGLTSTLSNQYCRFMCCEVHPQLLPLTVDSKVIIDQIKSLGFNDIEVLQRGTEEFHVLAKKS